MARREATQALTRVMERNHEVATVEGSLMQVAYQEAINLYMLLPFWEHLESKGHW